MISACRIPLSIFSCSTRFSLAAYSVKHDLFDSNSFVRSEANADRRSWSSAIWQSSSASCYFLDTSTSTFGRRMSFTAETAVHSLSARTALEKTPKCSRARSRRVDARVTVALSKRPLAARSFRHAPTESRPLRSKTWEADSGSSSRNLTSASGLTESRVAVVEDPAVFLVVPATRASNSASQEGCVKGYKI